MKSENTLENCVCIDFCQQRYQQFGEDSEEMNGAQWFTGWHPEWRKLLNLDMSQIDHDNRVFWTV